MQHNCSAEALRHPNAAPNHESENIVLDPRWQLPIGQRGLPGSRDFLNAVYGLLQGGGGGGEGKADEVFSGGAEGGSGNGGYSGFFQHDAANFFGGRAGLDDVYPGIEGSFGRGAAEAWHSIQIADELLAASSEFFDHLWSGLLAVAKGFDGGVLREFSYAGVGIHD